MLHIILLILKIIGVILLVLFSLLLLLLLTVLLVPVRYHLAVKHGEDQFAMEGTVSWLLHLLHAKISMTDTKPHIRVRIFGIIVFDNLKIKIVRTKKTKNSIFIKSKSIRKSKVKKTETSVKSISKTIVTESKRDDIPQDITIEKIIKDETLKIEQENEIYKQRQSLFQKAKNRIIKLKERIITFFKGIKGRIKKWIETSVNIKRKIDLLLEFIKDEINQKAFRLTYSSLIKLLKHILPTKLKSSIIFGTGDPCSTGQALGVFAALYSIYGDKIQITPDFENKRFEGRHIARGRIRLITVLIIVIKLMLDKRFKHLKNNMKTLKEAL